MNNNSYFIRVLTDEPETKGNQLLEQVRFINSGEQSDKVFNVDSTSFTILPESPFAYWLSENLRKKFSKFPRFEPEAGIVRQGLATGDDFQFVRAIWEVNPADFYFCYHPIDGSLFARFDDPIVKAFFARRSKGKMKWAFHVKAGASQPWYSPITVMVDWENDGYALKNFRDENGKLRSRPQNLDFFFRPGFSWTLRAVRLIPYIVPSNCIPTVSRYMGFPSQGMDFPVVAYCASNLATGYARIYGEMFERPKFLVDMIKVLPWSNKIFETKELFQDFISNEVKQRREIYTYFEPFQEFCYASFAVGKNLDSSMIEFNRKTLLGSKLELKISESFGLDELELTEIERDMRESIDFQSTSSEVGELENEDSENSDEEKDFVLDFSPEYQAAAFLQYAVGVVFGRWDIRMALDQSLAPRPANPFSPLPVCSPGSLISPDGLPASSTFIVSENWLRARPNAITHPESFEGNETIKDSEYPILVSWDGFLVDDVGNNKDIVDSVQQVIKCLWLNRADEKEKEICKFLGVENLRSWFRDPKGFWAFHLSCYSKSRRKAPIYWLIQSAKKNYAIWLYYPRLNPDSLFFAAREYADAKLNLENTRLEDLQSNLSTLSGSNLKVQEKKLAVQTALVAELKSYIKTLDAAALLQIKPDLNDGVLLNIAPLRELVPWKEPARAWDELLHGKYAWSHIAAHLRQKGFVKGA